MKRSYSFVKPTGMVECTVEDGAIVELPVLPGILKHLTTDQLAALLADPVVARKYTCEALRKAPWSALRLFPRIWLLACLQHAKVRPGRLQALDLLLSLE